MNQLKPGEIFAEKYRVERFLAQGGFGAVYVAEDIQTGARLALKVFATEMQQDPSTFERIRAEASISDRLASDHIVRSFESGRDPRTCAGYIAMELLQGSTLAELVATHGPLPWAEVCVYLAQTACGLDRSHGFRNERGDLCPIIHRDLKPANLFLTRREDGSPLIKILDFGLAKNLMTSSSRHFGFKGTLPFMAPEQLGTGKLCPQTDIWSFGLVAFYLLTGRNYWRAANETDPTAWQIWSEIVCYPLVAPSARLAELGVELTLPLGFDAWFSRCVERNTAKRFQTAGEAAAAFTRMCERATRRPSALDQSDTLASPLRPPLRFQLWRGGLALLNKLRPSQAATEPEPTWAIIAGAFLLFLLVGSGFTLWKHTFEKTAEIESTKPVLNFSPPVHLPRADALVVSSECQGAPPERGTASDEVIHAAMKPNAEASEPAEKPSQNQRKPHKLVRKLVHPFPVRDY